MNGMTPPLYPFPLAFQPVNEASCRPLSPQPKPGVFASHVGGGGSGDCQSLADIPCNVLAVVRSIQVANVVLTTVVADQSEARTQSPEAVAKMALASDVVVVQADGNCRRPRVVHRQRIQGRLHSTCQGKGSNSPRRKRSSSLDWKIHDPILFDMCR